MSVEQPKNFGFGADEAMLRDSARKFFADKLPPDALHRLVAADSDPHRAIVCPWDQSLWQQATELGWTAVCIPERAGGIGMPLIAAVALAEEAGRAGFPGPLASTLNASFVLAQCATQHADSALEKVASGASITLAITNQSGSLALSDTDVTVSEDHKLSGTSYFVQEARKSDYLLVSARGSAGIGLYLINTTDEKVELHSDAINDLTRDQAHISFDGAQAIEILPQGQGEATLQRALPAILCITSADMVGAGEWLLQTTVEYAQTRVQFDRPIGFFQAIKHPLVNLMMQIDNAKSLTYNAACAVDTGLSDALQLARMAKAQASDMAVYSASRAVQFHGGIGFTWECYVQLFFKRQMHSQVLFGDARHHRRHLADTLIGPISA